MMEQSNDRAEQFKAEIAEMKLKTGRARTREPAAGRSESCS